MTLFLFEAWLALQFEWAAIVFALLRLAEWQHYDLRPLSKLVPKDLCRISCTRTCELGRLVSTIFRFRSVLSLLRSREKVDFRTGV